MLHSSSVVGESDELEVESEDKLHWPAAGIVRCRNILIGRRDQPEGCSRIIRGLQSEIGPSQFRIVNCRTATNQEVDVVECVQQLNSKLDVLRFVEPDLFDQTHIETNKAWSFENQV